MAKNGSHVLSLLKAGLYLFGIGNMEMLLELLTAQTQEFHRLEEVIAKPVIKFSLNNAQLLWSLFGKRRCHVVAHNLLAIAHQMIDKEILYVGQHIDDTPWKQRDKIEKVINNLGHSEFSIYERLQSTGVSAR